jgi:hypothetical protein
VTRDKSIRRRGDIEREFLDEVTPKLAHKYSK